MARPKTKGLTKRQRDTLGKINDFMRNHIYPPTLKELSDMLKLSSTTSPRRHLDELKEKGEIDWKKGCHRSIRVLK